MTELIAILGSGKGTWGHVSRLLEDARWEKVYLLTNEFGIEKFQPSQKVELLLIHESKGIQELRDEIKSLLKDKIKGIDVGVNFVSGEGKEHMALVAALLQLGIGIRLVALSKDGAIEL